MPRKQEAPLSDARRDPRKADSGIVKEFVALCEQVTRNFEESSERKGDRADELTQDISGRTIRVTLSVIVRIVHEFASKYKRIAETEEFAAFVAGDAGVDGEAVEVVEAFGGGP